MQLRFADLDPLGHVNNVAFASLFESARTRLNREGGLWPRALIAAVEIHYLAEAHYPHDVTVTSGIGRVGTRSWTLMAAMFQHDRAVATCDAVLVAPDPLDDEVRGRLARWAVTPPDADPG